MADDTHNAHLRELGLSRWERRDDETPASLQGRIHDVSRDAAGRPPPPESESQTAVATMDWDQLEAYLAQQDHRGASRPVFGVGARDADLLIVGEAPGAEEDRRGEPFVGRAGKLLDRMLFAIDRSRESNAYIANICKFRPPNNRDPNPDEVTADRPFLERQIDLLAPKLIVTVGRVAAQNLLGGNESLGRMRGRVHRYPRREIPVLVTYHPAYLLRSPLQKARAWEDLRRAMELLREAAA
jgi:DNA polymerase